MRETYHRQLNNIACHRNLANIVKEKLVHLLHVGPPTTVSKARSLSSKTGSRLQKNKRRSKEISMKALIDAGKTQ